MNKQVYTSISSALILVSALANTASAGCVDVKGKIENNALAGSLTLGVVAMEFGTVKMKCAVSGVPQLPTPLGPSYQHTLVCDDDLGVTEAHSQITLNTSFAAPPALTGYCQAGNPYGQVSFDFQEQSVPVPGTGRGKFSNVIVEGSAIDITGSANCNGGINMKFQGKICTP